MRGFRSLQAYFLAPYEGAPTLVQVKSGILLFVTSALLLLQTAHLVVVELFLRRSLLGAAGAAALIALHGIDLWLLRRGRFQVAAVLSMLLLYVMVIVVGVTSVSTVRLLVAGKMTVLLGVFIVYTSLVGDRLLQPIVATAMSIATVVLAYSMSSASGLAAATPFETGWLINFCWSLVLVGILATLTTLIFKQSMRRAEQKTLEALDRAEDARRADAQLRRVEERLWQSEKLQAIGQLAGGVAHDFNNELTIILGYAQLVAQHPASPDVAEAAHNIMQAAERSAELTRQLLSFARKGPLRSEPTDVHELIRQVVGVLRHTLDRRINVVCELEAASAVIVGDGAQLHHALLNLSVNARDAMPEGGSLSFRTRVVDLEPAAADLDATLAPGAYLQVEVADTGAGMDVETRAHLFEPFFTTKGPGKGTGLGLAAVFGTVQSHRGAISCESEPGKGTVFKVLLPLRTDQRPRLPSSAEGADPGEAATRRRILLVDDEPAVLRVGAAMLGRLGHEVAVAGSGAEAVAQFKAAGHAFDLILLDLVMPDMGGKEVFEKIRAIQPGACVVLASGFSVEGECQRLLDAGARAFLQKPYRMAELEAAVEKALRR